MKPQPKYTKTMKTATKQFSILCFMLISSLIFAQAPEGVSIKNTVSPPDPSAMLDVSSSTKGLLIPRVALTSNSVQLSGASNALSLLVYNLAPAGAGSASVTPGFYFWNGTVWSPLGGGGGVGTSTLQWTPGPANLTADIYRPSGTVAIGPTPNFTGPFNLNPTGTSHLNVWAPLIVNSREVAAYNTHTLIEGVHIGEPTEPTEGHWNEINSQKAYLDMQYKNGQDIHMGGGNGGTQLSIHSSTTYTCPWGNPTGGNVWADGSIVGLWFWSSSDTSLKKNITPVQNVLTKVLNLNTISYNYKTENSNLTKHIGVNAQNVQEQFPELVRQISQVSTTNKFTTSQVTNQNSHKVMDYDGLSAILLQAIKEQQAQIQALQTRVTALENR